MKKSLIGVAVAAALPGVALAQSSVQITGIVKTGYSSYKLENGAAGNGNGFAMGDGSSRWILSGSEDLGGGMRAIFQMDTRFRPDAGTGGAPGGNTWIGLAGNSWGNVKFGLHDTHYHHGTDQFAARSTALTAWNVGILSFIGGQSIAKGSRTQNVARYESPTFGGFSGVLSYATNADSTEASPGQVKGNAASVQLMYSAGPLSGGLSYWNQKKTNPAANTDANADQQATRVWAGYNFGAFSVGFAADQSKLATNAVVTNETKRNAYSLPLTANVGKGTALLSYSVAQNSKLNGATVDNSGASLVSVGYDYPLSKRTSMGASYSIMNNKAAGAYALFTGNALHDIPTPTAGQDTKQLWVGLRHTF